MSLQIEIINFGMFNLIFEVCHEIFSRLEFSFLSLKQTRSSVSILFDFDKRFIFALNFVNLIVFRD